MVMVVITCSTGSGLEKVVNFYFIFLYVWVPYWEPSGRFMLEFDLCLDVFVQFANGIKKHESF